MSIRKALGAVKDQTSIGIAKVSSNIAPDLDVAIVKATSHHDDPADEKYFREILALTGYSRGYVAACVSAISKRLGKTRDWIVAVKSLMLVHRLMSDGDLAFQSEILYATRRGTRLLNMADFRDEAHSTSWDHSGFVRTYALYLDQKLEFLIYERKQGGGGVGNAGVSPAGSGSHGSYDGGDGYRRRSPGGYGSSPGGYGGSRGGYDGTPGNYGGSRGGYDGTPGNYGGSRGGYDGATGSYGGSPPWNDERKKAVEEQKPMTPLREMKPERVLGRMHQLQQLLDRFLACRPTGTAKNCRLILIALYQLVRESFRLYADICEILAVLLDKFFDMEYTDCVKAFEAYASAAKQIDELSGFYAWCKDTGVARSSEYPEVQRITDKLLETLEEFMRDKAKLPKTPPRREELPAPVVEEEPVEDMNSIKALPAPSDFVEQPPVKVEVEKPKPQPPQQQPDLMNLREDNVSADDQSNRLALALFSGPAAGSKTNGEWEAFPSQDGGPEVTSAWQNPAAEPGKADWELALVESASHLSLQKPSMAGGMDPLLLNGMYDQGAVRQQVSAQASAGSSSSVALPGLGRGTTPVLALPAPDGTVQMIGQDPFAASLSVPAPSYVQMAEIEKKQHLLIQEQQLWQQYAMNGMQGNMNNAYQYPNAAMPYGMPPQNGNGGYYYMPR